MSLKRKQPMKRSAPKRDWRDAVAKIRDEAACRVCGAAEDLEAAHVTGRRHDAQKLDGTLYVHPDSVLPLCREHHLLYDTHRLDLMPYCKLKEQVRAVEDAGGIMSAMSRISGRDA